MFTRWKAFLIVFCGSVFKFIYKLLQRSFFATPKKSVEGEVVLITGAGSGLGRELALKFAKLGASVVLCGTTKSKLVNVASEVRDVGGKAFIYKCDVSKELEVEKLSRMTQSEVGAVTILINNAGVLTLQRFSELDNVKVRRTMDVNLLAHYWLIKQYLPKMKELGRGHIVSVCSLLSLSAEDGFADYCPSKFAARGVMQALREELQCSGHHFIKLTTVCPGIFISGMVRSAYTKYPFLVPVMDCESVSSMALDGILRNQELVVIPKHLKILLWITEWLCTRRVARLCRRFNCQKLY